MPLTATRPAGDPALGVAARATPARAITLAMRSPAPVSRGWRSCGCHDAALIAEPSPRGRAVNGYTGMPSLVHGHRARRSARRGSGRRGADRLRDRARGRGARAGRQPHARRPRPDRPLRDAGDPPRRRGAGHRAARRLRPLRHARALRHVRGGDLVRPHPPALLRRRRSEGRRGRDGRALLRLTDLPPPPEVYGGIAEPRRRRC